MKKTSSITKLSILLAILSGALIAKLQGPLQTAQAEALNGFLATIPGPVALVERNSRSLVFLNSASHPQQLMDFAHQNELPEELMEKVFELPDNTPVPAGLKNVTRVNLEQALESASLAQMAVTPIALNSRRNEALFGAIYITPEAERFAIVVVWMKWLNGKWLVHKSARMS